MVDALTMDLHLMSEPKCEGCGKRPEVFGSSWCTHCHDTLPPYIQDRLLKFRNACIAAYWARTRLDVERILSAVLECDPVSNGNGPRE